MESVLTSVGTRYIIDGVFAPGVEIQDRQDTYYKNINKRRPDMKIIHSFYFVAELFDRSTEKYLGGFTTYS